MVSKKKEQNQKPTVFLWTLFLFDNDSNNLYFYLPFSFSDRQTRPNWHKLVDSSAFSEECLHNLYFFPLYVIIFIQFCYYTVFLFFFYEYIRYIVTCYTEILASLEKKNAHLTNDYTCSQMA